MSTASGIDPNASTQLRCRRNWQRLSRLIVDGALGGGLSAANVVTGETPSGAINGSNTVFTLANTPTAGTVAVYVNGLRFHVSNDYTISGGTITFTVAPETGDIVIVDYLKP